MRRLRQVLVVGYNEDLCTPSAREAAYRVGAGVARRGAVLVTGGLGGVMEAAARGAAENGGITVAIIPQKNLEEANSHSMIVIGTGMGYLRNFVNIYSSDGVIVVGGGAGTLTEVAAAYMEKKPIVALRGLSSLIDRLAEDYIDERRLAKIMLVDEPEEAVELLFRLIDERGRGTSG